VAQRRTVLRSALEKAEAFEGEVVGEASIGGVAMPVLKLSVICPTCSTTGSRGSDGVACRGVGGCGDRRRASSDAIQEPAEGAEPLLHRWS
jgi:hypothetical protein